MDSKDLFEIWEKGNEELFVNQQITKEMIEKHIKPKIRITSWSYLFNIIFYCLIQIVCIILFIINAIGYRSNTVMLSAIFPMMILSAGFFIYGFFLYVRLKEINNFTSDLTELISKKLHFLRTHYEVWLLIISLSSLFLIFGVTTMVDNQDGMYRIYNVRRFTIICTGIFVFIYGVQKLVTCLSTGFLKAYLKDLRNNILEGSIKIERHRKKYQWIFYVLAIIGTITAILGFLKSKGVI